MNRTLPAGDVAAHALRDRRDNDLAAAQDWTILDRRGNWNEFAETIGVTPVTTTQTRTRNGVNEYQAIDPDGPGGPQLPVNLAHDANGNLTLDPTARNLGDGQGGVPDPSGQVYEYDEENRLTAVRRASDNALLLSIAYDAVGRRISSADYLAAGDPCGGPPALMRHIYAALETLQEHFSCDSGTNYALAREFIWGDRFPQPVALITHGGTSGGFGGQSVPAGESAYHYLHDVLGSIVALTNSAGQVVERYTYDPYGKIVIEETSPITGLPTARLDASAFGNPFAWTGQRYDAGVRLYHFLFRGYSPQLGRWLERDPLGYIDGPSLYLFGLASPLRYLDPFGLDGWDWVQGGLDVAGFIPGVGIGADLLNAGISGARGNWGDAAINVVGAIPLLGDAAKGAKMAAKAADAAAAAAKAADAAKAAENAADAAKAAENAGDAAKTGPSTTPDGRPLSHHYETETGPQRKIPGSVVDETIKNNPGVKTPDGKTVYYDPANDVTVVVGTDGRIVSAHRGKPRKDQLPPNDCPEQKKDAPENPAPPNDAGGHVGPPAPPNF